MSDPKNNDHFSDHQAKEAKRLVDQWNAFNKHWDAKLKNRAKPRESSVRQKARWLMWLAVFVISFTIVLAEIWPTIPLRKILNAEGTGGYFAVVFPIALVVLFPVSYIAEKITRALEKKNAEKK